MKRFVFSNGFAAVNDWRLGMCTCTASASRRAIFKKYPRRVALKLWEARCKQTERASLITWSMDWVVAA